MALLLLFQGLYQQEFVPPAAYTVDTARFGPSYKQSSQDKTGKVLAVTTGAISTVVDFTTTRRMLIRGFLGTGTGDGMFWLNFNGVDQNYMRTNINWPNADMEKKEPIIVDAGVDIKLKVLNLTSGNQDYYGFIKLI